MRSYAGTSRGRARGAAPAAVERLTSDRGKMRIVDLLLALLSYAACALSADYDQDDVIILNDENFSAAIAGNKLLLVEFYAPVIL